MGERARIAPNDHQHRWGEANQIGGLLKSAFGPKADLIRGQIHFRNVPNCDIKLTPITDAGPLIA